MITNGCFLYHSVFLFWQDGEGVTEEVKNNYHVFRKLESWSSHLYDFFSLAFTLPFLCIIFGSTFYHFYDSLYPLLLGKFFICVLPQLWMVFFSFYLSFCWWTLWYRAYPCTACCPCACQWYCRRAGCKGSQRGNTDYIFNQLQKMVAF